MLKNQIFLGGSCNPTTWRLDIAIPMLESAGVAFYNPQVDDWHEGLIQLEADAKVESEILLFVIDGQTRAIASILEAVEYGVSGRNVFVVIDDIEDGCEIDGQSITGRELTDLNRARKYLADVVGRHDSFQLFKSVEEAVGAAAKKLAG